MAKEPSSNSLPRDATNSSLPRDATNSSLPNISEEENNNADVSVAVLDTLSRIITGDDDNDQ